VSRRRTPPAAAAGSRRTEHRAHTNGATRPPSALPTPPHRPLRHRPSLPPSHPPSPPSPSIRRRYKDERDPLPPPLNLLKPLLLLGRLLRRLACRLVRRAPPEAAPMLRGINLRPADGYGALHEPSAVAPRDRFLSACAPRAPLELIRTPRWRQHSSRVAHLTTRVLRSHARLATPHAPVATPYRQAREAGLDGVPGGHALCGARQAAERRDTDAGDGGAALPRPLSPSPCMDACMEALTLNPGPKP